MVKVHVFITGFGPFPNVPINPSTSVGKELRSKLEGHFKNSNGEGSANNSVEYFFEFAELDTCVRVTSPFFDALEEKVKGILKEDPLAKVVLFHIGVLSLQLKGDLRVEVRGYNELWSEKPDIDGIYYNHDPIEPTLKLEDGKAESDEKRKDITSYRESALASMPSLNTSLSKLLESLNADISKEKAEPLQLQPHWSISTDAGRYLCNYCLYRSLRIQDALNGQVDAHADKETTNFMKEKRVLSFFLHMSDPLLEVKESPGIKNPSLATQLEQVFQFACVSMQYPPSSVPFADYVLKAIEHPPNMFVSKLAACCAMLFLTRSDPELLQMLSRKWALRFHLDRKKLLDSLRRRSSLRSCVSRTRKGGVGGEASVNVSMDRLDEQSNEKGNPEEAVEHLMRILNSLILTYFSWNWHKTDYVIQINKEYEALIRENVLPICIVSSAADGVDDPPGYNWLIAPDHSPLSAGRAFSHGPLERSISVDNYREESSSDNCSASSPIRISGPSSGFGGVNSASVAEVDKCVNGTPISSKPFQAPFAPRSIPVSKTFPKTGKSQMPGSPFTSERASGRPNLLSYEKLVSTPTEDGGFASLETSSVFSTNDNSHLFLLTLQSYRQVMERNTTGVIIIFHARFSVKSNEVIEIFREFAQRKPLNPMPLVTVVYSATEPELASLYSIRFIPTIIYTPPDDVPSVSSGTYRTPRAVQQISMTNGFTERKPMTPSSDLCSPVNSSSQIGFRVGSAAPIRIAESTAVACSAPTRVSDLLSSSKINRDVSSPSTAFSPTEMLYGLRLKYVGTPNTVSPVVHGASVESVDNFANISDDVSIDRSSCTLILDDEYEDDNEELQCMLEHDNHAVYPMDGACTFSSIVEWVESGGTKKPKTQKTKNFVARMNSVRAEEKLKRERELHSAIVLLRRLQGMQVPNAQQNVKTEQQDAPLFIFLGGGMAAGKTTAAAALAQSAWWKDHKDQSVVVNADEFKVNNPLQDATRPEVHARSTKTAESLLVQAINQGRSIVYDSTMMWEPYVRQVVDMVRRSHLVLFKQGRGYLPELGIEEYFVESEKRCYSMHQPYRVHFLGITVEPEIAVPRGFIRKFTSGRGVPIPIQLRSFKYFAKNFATYVSLMDSTTLYDNNVYVDLDKGELPPVMAEANKETGNVINVRDEAAYQEFLKQTTLNEEADNILEIYPNSGSALNLCSSPTIPAPGFCGSAAHHNGI